MNSHRMSWGLAIAVMYQMFLFHSLCLLNGEKDDSAKEFLMLIRGKPKATNQVYHMGMGSEIAKWIQLAEAVLSCFYIV